MTRSRSETRRANDTFTAAEDAMLQRLEKAGYGASDIAAAVPAYTCKQVVARLYFLAHGGRSRGQVALAGWPVHDPRKINDWGKGFWDENLVMRRPK